MDCVFKCPMLRSFLRLLKFKIRMFSYTTLLIAAGDVTVISWNSRSPEKGSSLKWQLSDTYSWALQEYFMIRIHFRVENCKCTKPLQWIIHITLLEFIRTILLHSSQVDDGKGSDFGLVFWLSRFASPGLVSMSPDSRAVVVIENGFWWFSDGFHLHM